MNYYNQAGLLREFNETHREQFEPKLFERDNYEMVNAIEHIVRSCERDRYFTLKILSFEAIYNYEDIYNTLREHEEKRRKKNSKVENSYDFINIKDTDMMLVKVVWLVRHNGVERQEEEGKTIEVVNPEEILEVLIALPRFMSKYYFKLNGNYYSAVYQIVDGSTYNNSTSNRLNKSDTVTAKTMFTPIRIFRTMKDLVDVNTKEVIKTIEYNSSITILGNVVNAMFYFFANFGFYGTCNFLDIHCVVVNNVPVLDNRYYCFKKYGIYISCPKICFQDAMVQSMVYTIYTAIGKDTHIDDLFDQRFWLKTLGAAHKNSSIDKGLFVLDSVDGFYDQITKRDLHLPEEDKENIYCLLRWQLREFSNLKTKENTDVRTKRVRIPDYVAAVYAYKLNWGMHRISDLGRRVTLKKVKQVIYTQPMYILNNLSSTMNNLVSYRDMVNDNDATTALKFTYKGISGLGEDGSSVQPIYRYVDPSHVGILDLDTSSSSDPGMSGMINPMTKLTEDNSFSDYEEPNTWRNSWSQIQSEYKEGTIRPIEFTRREDQKIDYLGLREKIVQEELEINRIICPIESTTDPNILFTCGGVKIEQEKQKKVPSLFTIRDDKWSGY